MKHARPLLALALTLGISISAPASATGAPAVPMRLNQATAAELGQIEGVDGVTARRIVELREQRGRIGSIEALRILALPEDTLQHLREGTVLDLAVREGGGKRYANAAEVLQEFAGEPDVRAVQAMTLRYTNTNPDLVEGWLSASRTAYILPKLQLGYEKKLNLNNGYDYQPNENGDLESVKDDADADNDDKYTVKMEWRLDKLVMSSERIRVINEAQDIVKLRDKVLDQVTRLYFDRRRLQVDRLLNPPGEVKGQIESELHLQELTANLDALTGGAFSAALPASE